MKPSNCLILTIIACVIIGVLTHRDKSEPTKVEAKSQVQAQSAIPAFTDDSDRLMKPVGEVDPIKPIQLRWTRNPEPEVVSYLVRVYEDEDGLPYKVYKTYEPHFAFTEYNTNVIYSFEITAVSMSGLESEPARIKWTSNHH